MDGRILYESLSQPPGVGTADYSALRGAPGASTLAADEEAQLAERLKGLGYM
jgi:hypothetical protein